MMEYAVALAESMSSEGTSSPMSGETSSGRSKTAVVRPLSSTRSACRSLSITKSCPCLETRHAAMFAGSAIETAAPVSIERIAVRSPYVATTLRPAHSSPATGSTGIGPIVVVIAPARRTRLIPTRSTMSLLLARHALNVLELATKRGPVEALHALDRPNPRLALAGISDVAHRRSRGSVHREPRRDPVAHAHHRAADHRPRLARARDPQTKRSAKRLRLGLPTRSSGDERARGRR